jgi:hypothetical protein
MWVLLHISVYRLVDNPIALQAGRHESTKHAAATMPALLVCARSALHADVAATAACSAVCGPDGKSSKSFAVFDCYGGRPCDAPSAGHQYTVTVLHNQWVTAMTCEPFQVRRLGRVCNHTSCCRRRAVRWPRLSPAVPAWRQPCSSSLLRKLLVHLLQHPCPWRLPRRRAKRLRLPQWVRSPVPSGAHAPVRQSLSQQAAAS